MRENNSDVSYPYKLFFYDCIWEKNKIIYAASNCNAICETDIKTGDTTVVNMPTEKKNWLTSGGIYKWENYFLILNTWTALELFNLKSKKWSYITLDGGKKNWINFRGNSVFEYNGYLYVFQYSLVVVKVCVDKGNAEYLFYPEIKPDDDTRGEIVIIENIIYIPLKHSNVIYKFDLRTEQWEVLMPNIKLKGIDTLCFDGNLFWMTGIGKMICSWDERNNKGACYEDFPEKFKKLFDRKGEDGFWFISSVIYDNSIYFIPGDSNMVIEFNIKNYKANELFIEDEWEDEADTRKGRFSAIKYMGAKKKENTLMLLSNKNKNLIFINLDTKKISKVELNYCKRSDICKLLLTGSILSEKEINLNKWLGYLDNSEWQCGGNERKNIGKEIYYSF